MIDPFPMFVIYEKPLDFPNSVVCRRFDVTADALTPTDHLIIGPSLQMVRELLTTSRPGLSCAPRNPKDDPCIVETWF